ncbi:MAG: oligosaccharide flippase family protein [Elusimicrobia bacterium]|nr:oligosaccharide flippase family protein [Elusimicrobiota bacterium]
MLSNAKKIFLTGTFAGYATTFTNNIVNLIAVPLSLSYFGIDKYGALMLVLGVVNYLAMSNFGIPQAVSVIAAKTLDSEEQHKIVIRAFSILSFIVLTIVFVFFTYFKNVELTTLLGKIPFYLRKEVSDSVWIFSILFLLNIPFTAYLAGFIATNRVSIERLYAAITSMMILFSLLLTIALKGDLVMYALIRGIFLILVSFTAMLHFTLTERKYVVRLKKFLFLDLIKSVSKESSLKSILFSGFSFFLIGLAATIVWNTDNFVISHILGVSYVTPYSISFRLITMTFIVFTAFNTAILPMFGKACGENRFEWINNTYNKITFLSSALGGFVWLFGIAFSKNIIDFWTGPSGYAGLLTIFSLSAYGYCLSMVSVHVNLLYSLNAVSKLAVLGWVEAALNFILSIVLIRYWAIGGVALGTLFSSIFTVFWITPILVRRETANKLNFKYKSVLKHFLRTLLPCLCLIIVSKMWLKDAYWSDFIVNSIIILGYSLLTYKNCSVDFKEIFRKVFLKPFDLLKASKRR